MRLLCSVLLPSLLAAAAVPELATQVAPEIGADALLRLIEKGRVKGMDEQKKTIERAAELARLAREPVLRRPIPGLNLAKPPEVPLDRLSLETRAIFALTQLDPGEGAKLFRSVPRPTPRPITCADDSYDDLTPYAALLRVFGSTEDKLAFIQSVSSHAELGPAVWLADEEVTRGALSGVLARLTGQERLFTGLLPETLAKFRGLPVGDALKDYVKRNLTTEACKESGQEGWQRNTRNAAAAEFQLEVPPPSLGAGLESRSWLDEDRQSQVLFHELLFARDKNTPQWQDKFAAYLQRIREGKASFDRQAEMFAAAYIASPRGLIRETVLTEYVTVLAQASLQRENPAAWHKQAIALPASVVSLPEAEYESVLRAYERSGNPALSLIALQQRQGL
ncbi:MAG: hypothetical protein ACK6DY_08895 [Acidobacteriota bacterium]|jgi:hypothetical protein|nr:hypothetical protein [Bryobacteraceae bacterium CoA2 C42]